MVVSRNASHVGRHSLWNLQHGPSLMTQGIAKNWNGRWEIGGETRRRGDEEKGFRDGARCDQVRRQDYVASRNQSGREKFGVNRQSGFPTPK